MKGGKTFYLTLVVAYVALLLSEAQAWQINIKDTANLSDVALAVTVDGAGNVVAAGVTNNIGTSFDFTVIKFDGTSGAVLWRQDIDGAANSIDGANAVAVDAAGNVVAAGFTGNTGTFSDFTVVKRNGTDGSDF